MTDEHVMLDIETLGTDPGCVVCSIGAVRFDVDGIIADFHRNISLESCQDHGLTIDANTLEWWLGQGDQWRKTVTGGGPLTGALRAFAEFADGSATIWANSPAFDCAILGHAYDVCDIDRPWEYYDQRDYRTLTALPAGADAEAALSQQGAEHDALDDARYQARVTSEALEELGAWR